MSNLPLFSCISLMRNMKALQLMSVKTNYGVIDDQSPKSSGRKKPRKKTVIVEVDAKEPEYA